MDAKTVIAVAVTFAAGAVWFVAHRAVRKYTRRQRESSDLGVMTIRTGVMICMSGGGQKLWGLAESWIWICVTFYLVTSVAFVWRRFLTKTRLREAPVTPPASNPNGTHEAN